MYSRTDNTADLLTENAPYPPDVCVKIGSPRGVDQRDTSFRAEHQVNVQAGMCRRHGEHRTRPLPGRDFPTFAFRWSRASRATTGYRTCRHPATDLRCASTIRRGRGNICADFPLIWTRVGTDTLVCAFRKIQRYRLTSFITLPSSFESSSRMVMTTVKSPFFSRRFIV